MKALLSTLYLSVCHSLLAQTPRQVENLETFNRIYGYVKYFHPSDEAASVDWNDLVFYGSREVEKCKDNVELQKTLTAIFEPIAPTVKLVKSSSKDPFSIKD